MVVASACTSELDQACSAALVRPSVTVDLRALVAAHGAVSGTLCPSRSSDPTAPRECTTFSLTTGGVVTLYLTPGDDRLALHVRARDVGVVDSNVRLVAHRARTRCSNPIYTSVVVAADGVASP
jgi:hypothetical protein